MTGAIEWVLSPAGLTAVIPILVALIGGLFMVVDGRKKAGVVAQKTKTDIQRVVNEGFEALVTELQEERKEQISALDNCSQRIEAQSVKIDTLERAIRKLRRHIENLEIELEKHGIPFPPMPIISPPVVPS